MRERQWHSDLCDFRDVVVVRQSSAKYGNQWNTCQHWPSHAPSVTATVSSDTLPCAGHGIHFR